jgi:hypothetical protein
MANTWEKLLFIPHKSLLNSSNKHPYSTPPEFVKYSPFFIDESGKKPIGERLEGVAKETSGMSRKRVSRRNPFSVRYSTDLV